jgi:hypothetical protein
VNTVLRGIFGPKGDEVTGEWGKLHCGELHNLYSSPNIVRQFKSRRMRWAGNVARMGQGRNVYRVLVESNTNLSKLKLFFKENTSKSFCSFFPEITSAI